jgi:hypothetical protein
MANYHELLGVPENATLEACSSALAPRLEQLKKLREFPTPSEVAEALSVKLDLIQDTMNEWPNPPTHRDDWRGVIEKAAKVLSDPKIREVYEKAAADTAAIVNGAISDALESKAREVLNQFISSGQMGAQITETIAQLMVARALGGAKYSPEEINTRIVDDLMDGARGLGVTTVSSSVKDSIVSQASAIATFQLQKRWDKEKERREAERSLARSPGASGSYSSNRPSSPR